MNKQLFTKGMIQIELVINKHGEAMFQVCFPREGQATVSFQTMKLEIDGVTYIPAVSATKIEGDEVKRLVVFNMNEPAELVKEGEYLNL